MWEGKRCWEPERLGCSLPSRLQLTHSPRAPAWWGSGRADLCRPWIRELGGEFGHASIRPMTRLGSSCRARPGAQVSAPRPWRRANDPWHLATEPWASGQEQWRHCHTQHHISSKTEPDVRRKRDMNKETQGLWGQKRAMTHIYCRCPGLNLWTVGGCRGTVWTKGPCWGLGVPEHRGTLKGSALFLRGWESHCEGCGLMGDSCVQSKGVRLGLPWWRSG